MQSMLLPARLHHWDNSPDSGLRFPTRDPENTRTRMGYAMNGRPHEKGNHRRNFQHGLLRAGLLAGAMVVGSLAIGILGYRRFAGLGWVDSFYSASMIMSGMGPTEVLRTAEAKVFAGLYALYSGLVLIASTGVVLSPFMTRVLHAFHAEQDARR